MKILDSKTAYELLMESKKLNSGRWIEHSMYTGLAAECIAKHLGLNSDLAKSYGYIHDIGRRFGIMKMRHVLEGYKYLSSLGYEEAARYCLTHSFPSQDVETALRRWDGSKEDFQMVKEYVEQLQYTPMDKLIQLCDYLALPSGFTIVERRMVDIALRHGIVESAVNRWRSVLEIQKEFEEQIGQSIYAILPDISENIKKDKISNLIDI